MIREWEEQIRPARRAWKKLEEAKIGQAVGKRAKELGQELDLPPLNTTDDIEAFLDKPQKGIQRIVESSVPYARPSSKAKSFWNPDCTRVTIEAKRRLREFERTRNAGTDEARRLAEREKTSVLNRAKTLHFRESIDRLATDSRGLWTMAKWGKEGSTKPKDLPKFPSPRANENARAETHDQKVHCLRKGVFSSTSTSGLG